MFIYSISNACFFSVCMSSWGNHNLSSPRIEFQTYSLECSSTVFQIHAFLMSVCLPEKITSAVSHIWSYHLTMWFFLPSFNNSSWLTIVICFHYHFFRSGPLDYAMWRCSLLNHCLGKSLLLRGNLYYILCKYNTSPCYWTEVPGPCTQLRDSYIVRRFLQHCSHFHLWTELQPVAINYLYSCIYPYL